MQYVPKPGRTWPGLQPSLPNCTPRPINILLIPPPQGVCVCAYGADEFPAFFTPHSGCAAPARADSPEEAARMIAASRQLELGGGIVFGALPASLTTAMT